MINFLLANVVFPTNGGGIQKLVYIMLEWIMSWPGFVSYGFAIVVFTLLIKLIMLPLDFVNKYFTKKNQIFMQKVAPEERRLREIYAGDPLTLNRERQKLYARNGSGQAGFCLVVLVNLVLTLVVFFSVFAALRTISYYNINNQVKELHGVYEIYKNSGDDILGAKLNEKYDETNIKFLWVKNIWRKDTWEAPTMTWAEFQTARNDKNISDTGKANITESEYTAIFDYIEPKHTGWNGLLLLVALAGGVTYLSVWISSLTSKKQAPQKAAPKIEPIITYSSRGRQNADTAAPSIDLIQMSKIMPIVMPIMMIIFAFTSTAAMAIYIIASSLISTGFTLLMGLIVDQIIKRRKPKQLKCEIPDKGVINPHTKYFKNKEK